jgi:signal transduction histidine kinase
MSARGGTGAGPRGVCRPEERAFLRRHPLFEGLDEDDLDRLLAGAAVRELAAGTVLLREGEPGESLYVVLDGEVEVGQRHGERDLVIATRGAGEFIGEMALLEGAARSATVRTLVPTRVLTIDRASLATLLAGSATAALTILSAIVVRLRNVEAMLMQREKLAGLGTMAAGLAHELNNPASAIVRAGAQLGDALVALETSALAWARLGPSDAELAAARDAVTRPMPTPAPDPLGVADLEEAIEAWLRARGVGDAAERAWALATDGWTAADLERWTEPMAPPTVSAAVAWQAAAAASRALLREIRAAAQAISEVVSAVRSYAYLDRTPVQRVDVQQGIEGSLVMLRHKLRDGIRVERAYAPDLPPIEAHGSELNQVWTNLIHNAIDAMGDEGVLTIRTRAHDAGVTVEIQDDGPGIPEEVLPRVFDPFFTTKPVGSGTGLGLHIAHTIVVGHHHGQIRVRSRPGATCFSVSLPLGGDDAAGGRG